MQDSETVVLDEVTVEVGVPEEGSGRGAQILQWMGAGSYYLFQMLVLLAPFAFLPIAGVPLELSKKYLLASGVLLALAFWLLSRLASGEFEIPKSKSLYAFGLVLVATAISTFVSDNVRASLVGYGFEALTLVSTAFFLGTLFLASLYFTDDRRSALFFRAVHLWPIVLFVVSAVHIYVPGFDLLNFLGGATGNLVGKWNDLGIFFGLTAIISLAGLELLTPRIASRALSYMALISSLLGVLLVSFQPVWWALAFVSGVLLMYRFVSLSRSSYLRPSMAVLLLAALFIVFGRTNQPLAQWVSSFQTSHSIATLEARPSVEATRNVVRAALSGNRIFGVGPNQFSGEWRKYRPATVNETLFWNSDFPAGYGLLPTILATHGWLGFGLWLMAIILTILSGAHSLVRTPKSEVHHDRLLALYLGYLYLTVFFVGYVPDTSVLFLYFLIGGSLIATAVHTGLIGVRTVRFSENNPLRFPIVLAIVFLSTASLLGVISLGQKFSAMRAFQQGITRFATNTNPGEAAALIEKAVARDPQDLYYRTLSELRVVELGNVVNDTSTPASELTSRFQGVLSSAIASANRAIELDKQNILNHIALGRVYESIVPLKIDGAYESALRTYEEAAVIEPGSPLPYLHKARLEAAKGNLVKARAEIAKGLELKSNFTEIIFLSSRIEADAGNTKAAIRNAEKALVLAPEDVGLLFQLGFLRYLDRNFTGAVSALARAVELSDNYSNARYFLGLSLDRLGEKEQALNQFLRIQALNPENAEVKTIVGNLSSGRPALSGIDVPGNEPEKRDTPPVKEGR